MDAIVNAMSLFKNPMILMAIFSLGLIVGMPYLLENSMLSIFTTFHLNLTNLCGSGS